MTNQFLACLLQTAMLTVQDLVFAHKDELLHRIDIGGAAKPVNSLLSAAIARFDQTLICRTRSALRKVLS